MQIILLLIMSVLASEDKETATRESSEHIGVLVKIEEDECIKTNSNYIGVSYKNDVSNWRAQRWSKNKKKMLNNGTYKDEETAARASDTLARKLIANGEKYHKLNFPDDHIEVGPEKLGYRSDYIGAIYNKKYGTWCAQRYSKDEKNTFHNGTYKDEETAARASDTLARKLIASGEKGHKLNFPNEETGVYPEKTSDYIGLSYHKKNSLWSAQRYSKNEKKNVHNGYYKNEETAARASDTLARKLIANGEKGHKLNFPNDDTEVGPENQNNKRKRPEALENTQKCKRILVEFESEENGSNL